MAGPGTAGLATAGPDQAIGGFTQPYPNLGTLLMVRAAPCGKAPGPTGDRTGELP